MKRKLLSLSILFAMLITACGEKAASTPEMDATQMAEAVSQALTQAAPPAEQATATPAVEGAASQLFQSNGIALMLPEGVAETATGALLPSVPAAAGTPDWEVRPPSLVLTMTQTSGVQGLLPPRVQVFGVVDYELSSPLAAVQVQSLRRLLAELPNDPLETPFLPLVNATQLLNTQVRYLSFKNGRGVRALAAYGQAGQPVSNPSLAYLFMGLTNDGLYLVSASFPVKTTFLAESADPAAPLPVDGIAFPNPQDGTQPQTMIDYYSAVAQKLETTPMQQFEPALGLFDALVTSMELNPTLAAQSAAPTQAGGTPQPVTGTGCTNIAAFVSETVPDNTAFPPGQAFTKSWVLRNAGTCTWTTQYALVFSKGEQMGGSSPIPLPQEVPPTGTVELKVELTAPATTGRYSGEWKLQNTSGGLFGLGGSDPVWVRIDVSEAGSGLNLGVPKWRDSFEKESALWFLADDGYLKGEIKDGALTWTALQPGGDRWRVAYLYPIGSFYLEARVRTGPACSGADSYGLLLRANPNENNIYDNGTILGVSCEGQFRVYTMTRSIFRSVQNWTSSTAILPGPNQTNVIGAWYDGNLLKVYINQQMVAEMQTSGEYTGLFGFMINGAVTPGFQVAVDEMAFWSLYP